jgi:hypothetical protein
MRYVLDFGSANAGGAPAFSLYARLDTLAALPQPTIVEIGSGQYYFDVDWSTTSATSITFKATLAGLEQSDVVSSPSGSVLGSVIASAATSSLAGYSTVGVLVARGGVRCGFLNLTAAQIATYDPFASTDPNVVQMLEMLTSLGTDLSSEVKAHLEREFALTTAGSATSYALPADFREMVDDTAWNRSGFLPLAGPVTPQAQQFIKAWNGAAFVNIPYRLQGNRLTFPAAPGNGLQITGLYYSSFWIQTAASGSGPDADHATAATDYVLFDPELVVRGLKLRWLEAKGFDTAMASTRYTERLEWAKGAVGGAGTLSLRGNGTGYRLIDTFNAPTTGLGA